MAGKFKIEVAGASRAKKTPFMIFNSWSCYPQQPVKKVELINRIGSTETIIQSLYESSTPTPCTAVLILSNSNLSKIVDEENKIKSMVGLDLVLTDLGQSLQPYRNLVISDLVTKIKAVNHNSWVLICEFNQFLRAPF